MSVQMIIATLTDLALIHEDLIVLSEQKTEIMKEGSVGKLQQILSQERKFVQALGKAETKRQTQVKAWCTEQGFPEENITITAMLEAISDPTDAEQLEQKTITLTNAITKLKQQEQLNQELIVQSMQFVQLSLDMMSPSLKNLNYGKSKGTETSKRSVFDSKA